MTDDQVRIDVDTRDKSITITNAGGLFKFKLAEGNAGDLDELATALANIHFATPDKYAVAVDGWPIF